MAKLKAKQRAALPAKDFGLPEKARSPEAKNGTTHGLEPHELSELIFAVARGMLMRDVLQPQEMTAAERRARQLEVTRRLWRLLFTTEIEPAYA